MKGCDTSLEPHATMYTALWNVMESFKSDSISSAFTSIYKDTIMGVILIQMVTFSQLLSFIDPHSRVKSKAIFNSREMLRCGASLGSAGSRECPRPGPPSCSNSLYYRLSVTYLNSDPILRFSQNIKTKQPHFFM